MVGLSVLYCGLEREVSGLFRSAKFAFTDETVFFMVPHSNNGIGRLDSVVAYRSGKLAAIARQYFDESRNSTESLFWSDSIDSRIFMDYWDASFEKSEKLKQSYDENLISENVWNSNYRGLWILGSLCGLALKENISEGKFHSDGKISLKYPEKIPEIYEEYPLFSCIRGQLLHNP